MGGSRRKRKSEKGFIRVVLLVQACSGGGENTRWIWGGIGSSVKGPSWKNGGGYDAQKALRKKRNEEVCNDIAEEFCRRMILVENEKERGGGATKKCEG